jgi:hypothetical protein
MAGKQDPRDQSHPPTSFSGGIIAASGNTARVYPSSSPFMFLAVSFTTVDKHSSQVSDETG